MRSLRRAHFLILFGLLLLGAAFAGNSLLDGGPLLTIGRIGEIECYSVKFIPLVLTLISSFLLTAGSLELPIGESKDQFQRTVTQDLAGWGKIAVSTDTQPQRILLNLSVKESLIWLTLFGSLFFLLIFLVSPRAFSKLCTEDQIIETLSAVFCILSAIAFAFVTRNLIRGRRGFPYVAASVGFLLVFFLIGMEEISWFQRILSIETPAGFEANVQDELNIHNFATRAFANAYYFGAFLALIFLPFVLSRFNMARNSRFIGFFLPSAFVLYFSSVIVAYTSKWSVTIHQFSFFMTVSILLFSAQRIARSNIRALLFFALISIIGTQIIFVLFWDEFVRGWDLTEYKEFFIPLAFLIYSLEVLQRSHSIQPPRPTN